MSRPKSRQNEQNLQNGLSVESRILSILLILSAPANLRYPRNPGFCSGPEQINRDERQQKIRDQNCCAGVLLRHSLTEEKCQDRDSGNDRTVKRDRRIARENDHDASDGA